MATLVTIATYHSLPKAEAARIFLAHEGIEAVLVNESIVAMDWLLMNAVGGVKLQVATQDVELASGFINKFEADQQERLKSQAKEFVRFNCSECGKPQQFTGDRRGGVETCTKCGCYIDVPNTSDEAMLEPFQTIDAAPDATDVVKRRVPLPVEVGCVLAFAYIPFLLKALPFWDSYPEHAVSLDHQMLYLIVNLFSVVPPLLLIIAVSNEAWSKFGITRPRWIVDSFIAVGIWFVATFSMALTMNLLLPADTIADVNAAGVAVELETAQAAISSEESIGWGTVLLCLVGLTANSIAEELAMRGYLIPRFEELFKSPAIAIGLSSAIFASYHIYQSFEQVVAVFVFGLVYGIFFYFLRRLWPLVIAHTLANMLIYLHA